MTDREVIKLAQGLITDFKCESDTIMDFCNTVIEKFEQQPKGKWIERWCEWQQYIECSECGYETGLRCNTNFCPNCGADMRGDCE